MKTEIYLGFTHSQSQGLLLPHQGSWGLFENCCPSARQFTSLTLGVDPIRITAAILFIFVFPESCLVPSTWKWIRSVMSDSLRPQGLYSPWNSPGQNTGVGSLSLLQGTFPAQGSNPGLLHCRRILYQLSHKGSPKYIAALNEYSSIQWIVIKLKWARIRYLWDGERNLRQTEGPFWSWSSVQSFCLFLCFWLHWVA